MNFIKLINQKILIKINKIIVKKKVKINNNNNLNLYLDKNFKMIIHNKILIIFLLI